METMAPIIALVLSFLHTFSLICFPSQRSYEFYFFLRMPIKSLSPGSFLSTFVVPNLISKKQSKTNNNKKLQLSELHEVELLKLNQGGRKRRKNVCVYILSQRGKSSTHNYFLKIISFLYVKCSCFEF